MKNKKWQKFSDDCLNCGCEALVFTDTGRDNWASDGDLAKCPECGLEGSVNVYDDSEGEASIAWHDEPNCDCSWCLQQKIIEKKDELAISLKSENEKLKEDLETIEHEVAKVYCHITGSRISKCKTLADQVIACADDYQTELFERELGDLKAELEAYRRALEWLFFKIQGEDVQTIHSVNEYIINVKPIVYCHKKPTGFMNSTQSRGKTPLEAIQSAMKEEGK